MTDKNAQAFEQAMRSGAELVETCLTDLLAGNALPQEIVRPDRLMEAMRYTALGGGKRLRPILFMESAAMFGAEREKACLPACALELIHCYSLVHDDLPAMDDDDLRRGKPTVHIAYDEATAILAGDSLLTLAFDVIARNEAQTNPAIRAELILGLARASGTGGMAGGQMLDLMAEKTAPDQAGIRQLQAMKTGALLRFACEGGAVFAGARPEDIANMKRFGEHLGAAFQLADDILDATSDAETMGKATAKDAAAGKGTLVQTLGLEAARKELDAITQAALDCVSPYGERAAILVSLAEFVAARDH
jgi:farnesyl diphosphate synthase